MFQLHGLVIGNWDTSSEKKTFKTTMAVINWISFFAIITLKTGPGVHAVISNQASDVGNWTVGDCILAKFAMDFSVGS